MRRLLALLVLCLSLTAPTSSSSMTSYGNLAITRLWHFTSTGRQYACTGFYLNEDTGPGVLAYLVTAGHCVSTSDAAMRDTQDFVLNLIDWRAMLLGRSKIHKRWDVGIGTLGGPEGLPKERMFTLAEGSPSAGFVYVHGFPYGVERISVGQILPPDPNFPGAMMIRMESEKDIGPGSSGSPVLNEYAQVIGVVWGIKLEVNRMTGQGTQTRDVIVTPVEAIRSLLALLEIPRA